MRTEHLDDRTYDLLFGVSRSVRYHNHRRRFYEVWNSLTVTVSVVGGSGAVFAFLGGPHSAVAAALAALVALAGALDLSVGTARCANQHADLARRFIGLEQRFSHGRNLTDAEHEELTRSRLEVEATEPPPLRLLDAICHYELVAGVGGREAAAEDSLASAGLGELVQPVGHHAAAAKTGTFCRNRIELSGEPATVGFDDCEDGVPQGPPRHSACLRLGGRRPGR